MDNRSAIYNPRMNVRRMPIVKKLTREYQTHMKSI